MSGTIEKQQEDILDDASIKKKDIFVGNLSLYTCPDKLKLFFSKFGNIDSVRVMIHSETRRSRRFGFISFNNEDSVKSVLKYQETQKFYLDGCRLDVKNAFKKSDEEGGVLPVQRTKKPFVPKSIFESFKSSPNIGDRKIFVGGLGQDTIEEDIQEFFSRFGEIKKIHLITDKDTNRSRGFCFILFSNEISANLALASKTVYIKGKQVDIKKAVSNSVKSSCPSSGPMLCNQLGTTSNVATPIYALQEASPNIATPVYTWPFTQTWPSLNLTNLNTALWNQIQASANLIQAPTRMELPNQARYTPYPLTTLLAGNSNLSSTFEQDPTAALYPLQSLLHAAQASSISFLTPPPTTVLAGNSNLSTPTTFVPTTPQVIQAKSIQYPTNPKLL